VKHLFETRHLGASELARKKICETRREGGIPFYVRAIVSSELADNNTTTARH